MNLANIEGKFVYAAIDKTDYVIAEVMNEGDSWFEGRDVWSFNGYLEYDYREDKTNIIQVFDTEDLEEIMNDFPHYFV